MFIRKKRNRSGTTSIVVVEKLSGKFKELKTIGVSSNDTEIAALVQQGKEWIDIELHRRQPRLDFLTSSLSCATT